MIIYFSGVKLLFNRPFNRHSSENENVPTGYFAINQTTDTGEEPIKDQRLCVQERS